MNTASHECSILYIFDNIAWHSSLKISQQLLERFEGPYKIVGKISPVLYDAVVNGKEVRVHASNMKPF